jgi:hypothetical protein
MVQGPSSETDSSLLIQELPKLYGNQGFIAGLTNAHHMSVTLTL